MGVQHINYLMVLSEKLLFITTNHLLRPIVATELIMQLLRVSRDLPLMILVCQEPLNLLLEQEGPSPIHHPNTAVLEVSNDNHSIELTACSIGGGSIEIRQFVIDNITVQPAGPLPIIVYIDHGKKHPNAVELTGVVEKIAPFYRKQSLKGPINDIYEFDIKNYMSAATIQQIEKQFKNVICL